MYKQSRDRPHGPQRVFKQMMTAGLLARKSGRGFYTYDAEGSPNVVADALTPADDAALEGARTVSAVGVVGSGTMATGIVEVLVKAGYDVVFVAPSTEKTAKVIAVVTRSLVKACSPATSPRPTAMRRWPGSPGPPCWKIWPRSSWSSGRDRGPRGQASALANLDDICASGTVLATTTSSLPVIEYAAATSRPANVIGMHDFNPAAT